MESDSENSEDISSIETSSDEEQDSSKEEGVYDLVSDDNHDSDIEDDKFQLPDQKAWGSKKKTFYSTDYVDDDGDNYNYEKEVAAKIEEQEALEIQKRQMQQLQDEDFMIETAVHGAKSVAKKLDIIEDAFKAKHQLGSEFQLLVDDFKARLNGAINAQQNLKSSKNDFEELKMELILNYGINVCMYLLLSMKGALKNNHPVMQRLYEYRQELQKVDAQNFEVDNTIEAQVGNIEEEENEENPVQADEAAETTENAKRAITYQMKKNKGLMPKRKKEQRNTRVKHRMKYRKALIRRKGAVKQVMTTGNYTGELFGIKASVSKSIKIK